MTKMEALARMKEAEQKVIGFHLWKKQMRKKIAWIQRMNGALTLHEFIPPFGPAVFDHEQYPPEFHLFLTCEYLRWKMIEQLPFEILIVRKALGYA